MTDVGMIYRSLGSTCNQPFNALLDLLVQILALIFKIFPVESLPGVPDMSFSIGGEVDLMNNDNGLAYS